MLVLVAAGLGAFVILRPSPPREYKPGEIVWKVKLPGVEHMQPVLYDGVLYARAHTVWAMPLDNAAIKALDARKGSQLDRLKGYSFGDMLAADGMLFLVTREIILNDYVDTRDAKSLARIGVISSEAVGLQTALLGYGSGVIYVGIAGKRLFAYDTNSRKRVWDVQASGTSGKGSFPTLPEWVALTADSIAFSTGTGEDTRQACLDRLTGSLRWERSVAQGQMVSDGTSLFVNGQGKLYALAPLTGATMWEAGTSASPSETATVAGGLIILRNEAFDAVTGRRVWTAHAGGSVLCPPAIVGTVVCYTSVMGAVEAYDLTTGATLWKTKPRGVRAFLDPPVAGDGLVYCWCDDNKTLYAIAVGAPFVKEAPPAATVPLVQSTASSL